MLDVASTPEPFGPAELGRVEAAKVRRLAATWRPTFGLRLDPPRPAERPGVGPQQAWATCERLNMLPSSDPDDLTAMCFGRCTDEQATEDDGVTLAYRDVAAWALAFDGLVRLAPGRRTLRPAGETTAPPKPVRILVDWTVVLDARTGEYLHAVEQGRGRA